MASRRSTRPDRGRPLAGLLPVAGHDQGRVPAGHQERHPRLSNELVVNIKDSSVLSVIGVFDLMFATKTVVGIYFKQVELYVVAALCYLCLTMAASWLLGRFARRLSVEPAPLLSTSDGTATVGTVSSMSSTELSLDAQRKGGR